MPHTTEESDKAHRAGSTARIAELWNKFHFSGRVIMCSVIFGLGLVLIGGIVFAINMDDVTQNDTNDVSQLLPIKPPTKYVGPVIMGIGGLIVTVGIIMCLFETQVCRKKAGDASPLIPENADPEGKVSDSLLVPSSHSHKNHKRGKYSPRKSKGKHAKSHSKEKNQSENPSPRSPPVTIEQSKNFMTSSEENFLTPPNVPNTLEQNKSDIIENSTSSSLMKSFTSSDPSLNQSTEFHTPSTSFKDTSISLNSSIEVDEKQGQVNFKTSEFMTPLTVEEDRIQNLLIRVKSEQKETANKEMDEKIYEINNGAKSETSPNLQDEIIKEGDKPINDAKNESIPVDALPVPSLDVASGVTEIQSPKLKNNNDEFFENKDAKQNMFSDNRVISNSHIEGVVENNEVQKETSHVIESVQDSENGEISSESSTLLSQINKNKFDSVHNFNRKITNDEAIENDLENSVSSDDTVVAPDVSPVNSKDNVQATLKGNSHTISLSKTESDLESLNSSNPAEDNSTSDLANIPSTEAQPNEISREESNFKRDNHNEKAQPTSDSS